MPASLHPVLDRSPALRAAADREGVSGPVQHWRGWHVAHRFTCANGHLVTAPPARLLAGRLRCARCDARARLDVLHALARDTWVICTSELNGDVINGIERQKQEDQAYLSKTVGPNAKPNGPVSLGASGSWGGGASGSW